MTTPAWIILWWVVTALIVFVVLGVIVWSDEGRK
jgi:hypothetical protein